MAFTPRGKAQTSAATSSATIMVWAGRPVVVRCIDEHLYPFSFDGARSRAFTRRVYGRWPLSVTSRTRAAPGRAADDDIHGGIPPGVFDLLAGVGMAGIGADVDGRQVRLAPGQARRRLRGAILEFMAISLFSSFTRQ